VARRGRWTLRMRAGRPRRYELEASTAWLRGHVCSVALGGRELPPKAWRYSGRKRVLRAHFRAGRNAVLVAKLGRC
jgi:hypothetical protein